MKLITHVAVFFILATCPVASVLFMMRWFNTDIETAWETFYDLVITCVG